MRTILGVNWGSEGVADENDDTNSFQTLIILQPMKLTLHWPPLLSINGERKPLSLLFETSNCSVTN